MCLAAITVAAVALIIVLLHVDADNTTTTFHDQPLSPMTTAEIPTTFNAGRIFIIVRTSIWILSDLAIVMTTFVYIKILKTVTEANFAKYYTYSLLILCTMNTFESTSNPFAQEICDLLIYGYLKLMVLFVSYLYEMLMNCEIYFFLKNFDNEKRIAMKRIVFYHIMCYVLAMTVVGITYLLVPETQLFTDNNVFDTVFLIPGTICLILNVALFHMTSRIQSNIYNLIHARMGYMFDEKLQIRKQLFCFVGILHLIDITRVVAYHSFGMDWSAIKDLRAIQGLGTFVILMHKRKVINDVKTYFREQMSCLKRSESTKDVQLKPVAVAGPSDEIVGCV